MSVLVAIVIAIVDQLVKFACIFKLPVNISIDKPICIYLNLSTTIYRYLLDISALISTFFFKLDLLGPI